MKYKNLGEYHDLYVQNDILFLADVLENFQTMHLEINDLDPTLFLTASALAWQAALKKTKVKLNLLTDIDILLTVQKGVRRKIYHSIYWYTKVNDKFIKDYDKNKESSYLQYWNINNLYEWVMSQNLPVDNFKLVISKFDESFIKGYNKESDQGYFLEVDAQYLEKLHDLLNDLIFLPERMKIEKLEKLVPNLHCKTECYTQKQFKTSIKSWSNF